MRACIRACAWAGQSWRGRHAELFGPTDHYRLSMHACMRACRRRPFFGSHRSLMPGSLVPPDPCMHAQAASDKEGHGLPFFPFLQPACHSPVDVEAIVATGGVVAVQVGGGAAVACMQAGSICVRRVEAGPRRTGDALESQVTQETHMAPGMTRGAFTDDAAAAAAGGPRPPQCVPVLLCMGLACSPRTTETHHGWH